MISMEDPIPDSALTQYKSPPPEYYYSSVSEDEKDSECFLCIETPGSCAPLSTDEAVYSLSVENEKG